jgi:predicted enzyme related to lactoylglutathione lyase
MTALTLILLTLFARTPSAEPWVTSVVGPQYFAVSVADVDRAAEWYGRVFGLEKLDDKGAEDGSWRVVNLTNDDLLVEIIMDRRDQPAERAHGFRKVGFSVPDVDAVADRIAEVTGERPRVVDFDPHDVRILQLEDPEGNVIQLTSPMGAAADAKPVGPLSTKAQRFRSLVKAGKFDVARAMMAPDPRRWWETAEGEGQPWRIDQRGPWADWDDHFRSQNQIVVWSEDDESATALVRETNDYFRLLERGWVKNVITYYFNEEGLIAGLLIDASGDRPQGRTEEFLAWAKTHDPAELEYLIPGGEIDPSGDHPRRFRNLLNRWRRSAGLEPIE